MRNVKKHLNNLQKLSKGEHSLKEVLKMSGMKEEKIPDPDKRYDLKDDLDIDEERCPECGAVLKVWHEPNGRDDYNVRAECPACGFEGGD